MNKIVLLFLIPFLFAGWNHLHSQSVSSNNSALILTFDEYMAMIDRYHPVQRIGELSIEKGRAYLLKSRGGFDAKISTEVDQKYFDDKNYFSLLDGGFKIPTWYGVEIKGSYERNRGQFLNEQNFVPDDGLLSLGVDIPLLRGLVIDQRRAQLKQAKIYQRATEFERHAILNDLYAQGAKAYYNWQEAFLQLGIAQVGVELADSVLTMVKGRFRNGDVAAIDTLEALISLQTRSAELLDARQKLVLNRIKLSPFLWQENGLPLEAGDNMIPQSSIGKQLDEAMAVSIIQGDTLLQLNPNIRMAELDIQQQDIQVKLQRENLKPDIRLNYNPLADFSEDILTNPVPFNDYKWGLRFDMPLLFRKERANYQLAKIEREKTNLKLTQSKWKMRLQYEGLLAQIDLMRQQQLVMDNNVTNYEILVRAEERKFQVGESSVFLINSRQGKFIDAQLKQLKNRYLILDHQIDLIALFGRWPEIVE